ncbi:MAG TPA: S26 family signal peptidase, partial [Verrucomicrobiae bacterium]|nr:S26 family signal peptidase [Verrucomicrobiae bacterium]
MILRWLFSQDTRNACAVHKHYRRLLASQRDILSSAAIAEVQVKLDELSAAIKEGHKGRTNIKAEELQFAAEKNLKPYPNATWRENVEVLLVALAVAMAIRTFFLQPFKIPTGSMQPTLFGVNSTPDFSRQVGEVDYITANSINLDDSQNARLRTDVQRLQKIQDDLVIPTGLAKVKAWFQGDSYLHFVAPVDGKMESISPPQK